MESSEEEEVPMQIMEKVRPKRAAGKTKAIKKKI